MRKEPTAGQNPKAKRNAMGITVSKNNVGVMWIKSPTLTKE